MGLVGFEALKKAVFKFPVEIIWINNHTWTEFEKTEDINRYHTIETTIISIMKRTELGGIWGSWWSLGCAAPRRLGTFMDFSQSFHNLRCLHFALHQKDISGSSRSPEVAPRCTRRRTRATGRSAGCCWRRGPRWTPGTTVASRPWRDGHTVLGADFRLPTKSKSKCEMMWNDVKCKR